MNPAENHQKSCIEHPKMGGGGVLENRLVASLVNSR
jgi:hypothetical protein